MTMRKPRFNQIYVSVSIRVVGIFTVFYTAFFVIGARLINNFGESLVRENLPPLLGANADPAAIQQVVDKLHNSLWTAAPLAYVVSFVAMGVVVMFFDHNFSRVLKALARYAEQVAAGNYAPVTIPLLPVFRDELTTLAESLVIMVDKIHAREQSLKQQVAELQIAVDHERKAKDVEEITESEFFTTLRARAHELRESTTHQPTAGTPSAEPSSEQ